MRGEAACTSSTASRETWSRRGWAHSTLSLAANGVAASPLSFSLSLPFSLRFFPSPYPFLPFCLSCISSLLSVAGTRRERNRRRRRGCSECAAREQRSDRSGPGREGRGRGWRWRHARARTRQRELARYWTGQGRAGFDFFLSSASAPAPASPKISSREGGGEGEGRNESNSRILGAVIGAVSASVVQARQGGACLLAGFPSAFIQPCGGWWMGRWRHHFPGGTTASRQWD